MINVVVSTREAAHASAMRVYDFARSLIADGKQCSIIATQAEDDRTLRQNRYYWGVILREVSEQAVIEGQRWTVDAWHELFKRTHLGYEITKLRVAGRKRKVVSRHLRSTAKLKVGAMSTYLEKVIAFAVTDLSVKFSLLDWEQHRE